MTLIKKYNVTCETNDPTISLQIPAKILKDLVLRAEENGTSIEVEFAIRIARSLERDLEMIDADNQLCQQAFDVFSGRLRKEP